MILITGATGTVGSEVVKRLSTKAIGARALTRDPLKAEANPYPHVQFVQGDFDDPESMRSACSGVDRAFLLTNSTERAEQQQIAFVRVAQESGVRHVVKLSQLHADASSPERFLRYYGVVEAAIQATGLTFTFLRPNLYMQGLLNFSHTIKQKNAFFAAAGDARISAVDVRDLADVVVAALTTSQHQNKIYSSYRSGRLDVREYGAAAIEVCRPLNCVCGCLSASYAGGACRSGFSGLAGGWSARRVRDVPSWRCCWDRTRCA